MGKKQRSRSAVPNILAPETSFVEDNFSVGQGAGEGDDSGGNVSDGEQQMKLCSLACCLPPAVLPGS